MYLLERIVSLLIFVILLISISYILSKANKKTASYVIYAYVLCLGIMGYFFIPNSGSDLTRLIYTMHYYAQLKGTALSEALFNNLTPGTALYFYTIGQLDNDRLLPFFSAIISFSFIFSILRRENENPLNSTLFIAVALFVFMSRGLYMQSIGNIRTVMSLAMFAWCVYLEYFEDKPFLSLLIPYIFAASIHQMAQFLLLYRLVYMIGETGTTIKKKTFRTSFSLTVLALIWLLSKSYINGLYEKMDMYLEFSQNDTGYWYFWEGLLSVISIILLIYIIVKRKQYLTNSSQEIVLQDKNCNSFVNFLIPLIIADIIFIPIEFNTFQRLSWFLSIMTIPLVTSVLRIRYNQGSIRIVEKNILTISFIQLGLACARGDLCSLKFFLW